MNPYKGQSAIAGPLQFPSSGVQRVRYKNVLSNRQKAALTALAILCSGSGITFVTWLALSLHPMHDASILGTAVYAALVLQQFIITALAFTLWLFASRAKDPVPLVAPTGLRIAMLTTIVPSQEPIALVARTLAAMKRVQYYEAVDIWLLDEGNDPEVQAMCRSLGVYHFSRKGCTQWNTKSGEFKARTKAGNHNAWRAVNEHRYDIVAQMDPDHVPEPDFLTRTLGYFRDPDLAFVVAPQVYGNYKKGLIQHASSQMAYLFQGIIQRGGNGLGAPVLIGTNHLYRVAAWQSVGGYQDSIIEDHLTALKLYGTKNPVTGARWRGLYTPDVLAIGNAPESWTDWFNQQRRWSYGIWEIALRHSPKAMCKLDWKQRLVFVLLQSFYPGVATAWCCAVLVITVELSKGYVFVGGPPAVWAALWGVSALCALTLFLWLRRFNLVKYERREIGLQAMLMLLFTVPVYIAAGLSALRGAGIHYAVTSKGECVAKDRITAFRPHLLISAVITTALVAGILLRHGSLLPLPSLWALAIVCLVCLPPVVLAQRLNRRTDHEAAAIELTLVPRVGLDGGPLHQPSMGAQNGKKLDSVYPGHFVPRSRSLEGEAA